MEHRATPRDRVARRWTWITISIEAADLAWLERRAARLHDGNLSAVIAEATKLLRHNESLSTLLDELGAPVLSPDELARAAAELDGSTTRSCGTRPRGR
jgi:hypothetical protein